MSAEEKSRPVMPARAGRRRRGVRRPLHPLNALRAILRLDASEADVAAIGQAMGEGLIDWDALAALAMQHLLAPAIWPALARKRLATPMPQAMRQFLSARAEASGKGRNFLLALEDMYLANAARNGRIRAQALNAIAALNAVGIEPAALKGTRLLLGGVSPFRHVRCLRDIDLVVPAGGWAKACAALRGAGYRDGSIASHAAAFILAGDGVEIDLHRRPLSLHAPADLPAYLTEDGFWDRAIPIDLPVFRCRQLPAGESLVQSILHTEVADLNFAAGDWALRYLYETAVITRDPTIRLDWSAVNDLAGDELGLPLRAHLHAANVLFDGGLPDGFTRSWRLRRHFLRCRTNARHPRSIRRVNILVHKLRQAMSPWYLRRKGFYDRLEGDRRARAGLWRARARALAVLLHRHGRRLPRLLFGDDDSGVPPPRV
jgi:hypothetical protein